MIDIRKLKELVKLMVNNDLTEIDLRDPDEQVTLRKHHGSGAATAVVPAVAPAPSPTVAPPPAEEKPSVLEGIELTSPMVGTFYIASDPDAAPFVTVGDSVGEGTVVCIVEAMKIFNEIKAECGGTIQKVLVKNGEAVEFGQPLFLIKPE
jgi:acetyl-CoA carboxylase biotin carboxyl carrier protein